MNDQTKIRYPSELASLHSWRIKPLKRPAQLQLEIQGASTERIQLWERQLTRLQSPCGCEQGAGGLLVGVIGYLLYLPLRPGGWGHPGWHEFWIGCGVVVITTSLGKAIGILTARRKLRQIILEIQGEWSPQSPSEGNYGTVGSVNVNPPRPCCGG